MMLKITTNSPEETYNLGKKIGPLLSPGDIVNLEGDLGAGKTLLVKGIAHALGVVQDEVTSPTFTLINEYDGRIPLYHFDVYRLNNPAELEDIGYEEYFYGLGVTVVEWGNLIVEYFPDEYLQISLEKLTEDGRELTFIPHGKRGMVLLDQLREVLPC